MMRPQAMVSQFHGLFGHPIGNTLEPQALEHPLSTLRLELIKEEFFELVDATINSDIVEIADALGDLVYVIYGYAIACGIDLDAVVEEIHRSNMTKLGADGKPVYREDGKILKGENYEPPRIQRVLNLHGGHDRD